MKEKQVGNKFRTLQTILSIKSFIKTYHSTNTYVLQKMRRTPHAKRRHHEMQLRLQPGRRQTPRKEKENKRSGSHEQRRSRNQPQSPSRLQRLRQQRSVHLGLTDTKRGRTRNHLLQMHQMRHHLEKLRITYLITTTSLKPEKS